LCNKINRETTEDGILIDKELAAWVEYETFAEARWERIKKWREANGIKTPPKAPYEPKKPITDPEPEKKEDPKEKYKDYPDDYEALGKGKKSSGGLSLDYFLQQLQKESKKDDKTGD
jgi:hypothetical protein